jgi:hypothetical protein
MLAHLSAAAGSARREAGCSAAAIAIEAGVDPATVYRFERARAWPRDPDELVAAYARLVGMAPRDLWGEGLARWTARK